MRSRCSMFLSAATWVFALPLFALIGPSLRGSAAATAQYGPFYANLQGEVLLDNPRVFVQKFIVPPGRSTTPRDRA